MKRSLIIFLLFMLSQVLGAFFAFGLVNAEAIATNGPLTVDVAAFDPVSIGIATLIAELLLIVVLIRFRLTSPRPLSVFTEQLPRGSWMALVGFLLLAFGMSFAMVHLDLDDFGMNAQFEGMKDSWLCLLTLAVVAPLAEELVFRDGILREFCASGSKPWVAITISAATFGFVHGDPAQALPAIIMGLALGWLYWQTGDLRLCLPAHILNNTVALAEMQWPGLEESVQACSPLLLTPAGIILSLVGIYLLKTPFHRSIR